ncbi:MAG: SUMF1/EgtB/PvdO family nonheme iron enzyme [Isosphaeraceae bacterium]
MSPFVRPPEPSVPPVPGPVFDPSIVEGLKRELIRPEDAFEPAGGADKDADRGGWPDFIARLTSKKERYRLIGFDRFNGEARYIPENYMVEGDDTAADGWPRKIRRLDAQVYLIRIPTPEKGFFRMGHDKDGENFSPAHDEPPNRSRKVGFYMQETEVTNGEILEATLVQDSNLSEEAIAHWLKGIQFTAEKMTGLEDYATIDPVNWRARLRSLPEPLRKSPAVYWSWQEANSYATQTCRAALPLEAQWEYAARSGRNDYVFPWGSLGEDRGNVDKPPGSDWSLDVGNPRHRDRSEQGVWDLAGNVREWCRDVFAPYPPRNARQSNVRPQAPAPNGPHVIRGNSVKGIRDATEVYRRMPADADRSEYVGFRVVVECKQFQTAKAP